MKLHPPRQQRRRRPKRKTSSWPPWATCSTAAAMGYAARIKRWRRRRARRVRRTPNRPSRRRCRRPSPPRRALRRPRPYQMMMILHLPRYVLYILYAYIQSDAKKSILLFYIVTVRILSLLLAHVLQYIYIFHSICITNTAHFFVSTQSYSYALTNIIYILDSNLHPAGSQANAYLRPTTYPRVRAEPRA